MAAADNTNQPSGSPQPEGNGDDRSAHLKKGLSGFMKGFGKAMGQAKDQVSKSAQLGSVWAQQKMAGAKPTPEDPDFLALLARLKSTKNEIETILVQARAMHRCRVDGLRAQKTLIETLNNAEGEVNDNWRTSARGIGNVLIDFQEQEIEFCKALEERFIVPLENFHNEDIMHAQKLKTQYKVAKGNYDTALAQLGKAQESNAPPQKKETAEKKRDQTHAELANIKTQMIECIRLLEAKKNSDINLALQSFYADFCNFYQQSAHAIQSQASIAATGGASTQGNAQVPGPTVSTPDQPPAAFTDETE